jgi:hypothetical protein
MKHHGAVVLLAPSSIKLPAIQHFPWLDSTYSLVKVDGVLYAAVIISFRVIACKLAKTERENLPLATTSAMAERWVLPAGFLVLVDILRIKGRCRGIVEFRGLLFSRWISPKSVSVPPRL